MTESPYRRLRRLLSPLHPNRLRAFFLHIANLFGWHHVVFWAGGLTPRRLAASRRYLREVRVAQEARRADPRLKIAVDISPFWEPLTGIGWYLYRLLENLAEREDLVLRLYGPTFIDKGDQGAPVLPLPRGRAIELVSYEIPKDFSIVYYHYADFLRRRAQRLVERDGNDLLFAPNFFLPPLLARCRGKLIATIHDLGFHKVPDTLRESTREQLERNLETTLRRATALLTDSEAVRQELIETFGVEAQKIHAVHLAAASVHAAAEPKADQSEAAPPPGTPQHYLLFVGTLEPRKGIATLLDAWREVYADAPDTSLVLAGPVGWKMAALETAMAEAAGRRVQHFGYLPEAQLQALYRGAAWLVFPSRYEGFGLPAVEAMAAGTPLLLSDLPVLRELAGDAALYAAPSDVAAWAALLRRALTAEGSLRAEYARRSRERAHLFSWPKTAEATARVFLAAAGRGHESRKG